MPLNEDALRKAFAIKYPLAFRNGELRGGYISAYNAFKAAYSPEVLQALGVVVCDAEPVAEVVDSKLADFMPSHQKVEWHKIPRHQGAIMSDHLEGLDANQKKALRKGLSALEAMADIWSAEVGLHGIAEKIADVPLERRVEFIKTMVLQGFIEGAYRHYLDHKDACDEIDRLKGGSHE